MSPGYATRFDDGPKSGLTLDRCFASASAAQFSTPDVVSNRPYRHVNRGIESEVAFSATDPENGITMNRVSFPKYGDSEEVQLLLDTGGAKQVLFAALARTPLALYLICYDPFKLDSQGQNEKAQISEKFATNLFVHGKPIVREPLLQDYLKSEASLVFTPVKR